MKRKYIYFSTKVVLAALKTSSLVVSRASNIETYDSLSFLLTAPNPKVLSSTSDTKLISALNRVPFLAMLAMFDNVSEAERKC